MRAIKINLPVRQAGKRNIAILFFSLVLTLAVFSHTNPSHGTLSAFDNVTGAFTYTPSNGYVGSDSFTYVVTDGTHQSSAATVNITVKIDPVIQITANTGTSVTFQQPVIFSTTVQTQNSTVPTGTVDFVDNVGGVLATGVSLSGGVATFQTSSLATGSHTISAENYSGDSNYFASSPVAATLSFTVNKLSSTTSLSVLPSSVTSGGLVTITATVDGNGTFIPTGTVTFQDNGGAVAGAGSVNYSVTIGNSMVATITTSALAVGSHSIQALYSGDAAYLTSSSSTSSATVNAPPSSSGGNSTGGAGGGN
jgi:hypothetical protein